MSKIAYPVRIGSVFRVTVGHGETDEDMEIRDANDKLIAIVPGRWGAQIELAEEIVTAMNIAEALKA